MKPRFFLTPTPHIPHNGLKKRNPTRIDEQDTEPTPQNSITYVPRNKTADDRADGASNGEKKSVSVGKPSFPQMYRKRNDRCTQEKYEIYTLRHSLLHARKFGQVDYKQSAATNTHGRKQ